MSQSSEESSEELMSQSSEESIKSTEEVMSMWKEQYPKRIKCIDCILALFTKPGEEPCCDCVELGTGATTRFLSGEGCEDLYKEVRELEDLQANIATKSKTSTNILTADNEVRDVLNSQQVSLPPSVPQKFRTLLT